MRFTKFIPIALALSLISPAFAADSATSIMNLEMPAYIDIAEDTANQVLSQTLAPDYVGGEIGTLTAQAAWNVTTNLNGDIIYLSATAKEGGVEKTASYGDASNFYVVFTNIGNPSAPGAGAAADTIKNIITAGGSAGGATSTDAIVFALSEDITPTGAGTDPTKDTVSYTSTPNVSAGSLARKYTLHNGTYNIINKLSSVYAGSFDTYDTAGTYRATLKLSHVAP